MTLPAIAVALALIVAIAALLRARATAHQLARLTESYWELRYESNQLKGRVARLEIAAGLRDPQPEPETPRAATTFVPLSSLKK